MLTKWNIYEIFSSDQQHGVKMRGRIRKFAIENNINLLTENASDKENVVRFAISDDSSLELVKAFVASIVSDPQVDKVMSEVMNPVLSKLKVNLIERY